jgi:Leucine-rich repeat (LRR) protein
MQIENQISLTRKTLYGIMLLGLFFSTFGAVNMPSAQAKEGATNTPASEVQIQEAATSVPEIQTQGIFTSCTSQSEIPATECEALVALYNSTNGASWTDKTGWLQTNTPCTWYGVTCTAGHVTELDLIGNHLSGTIPAQLGSLANLLHLDLSNNQLTGSIPVQLGNLMQLTYLNLDGNQLTGGIPAILGSLTNLYNLSLYNNQLTGSIPVQLGGLTNLFYLDLSKNQLTGSIPEQLGGLTNLRDLCLYENQLTGSIPAQLGSLTNLLFLALYENQLTGSIPAELGSLTNLGLLDLYHNQLTGSIPMELGNLTNLDYLYLANNQLTGSVPAELGNLTNLNYLYLYNNQLTGNIPVELGNLTNLEILTLNNNQLTGSVPAQLGNLINLVELDMAKNQLTGNIPAELGNLTQLRYLLLNNNNLGGEIPASITSMSSLTILSLSCGLTSNDPVVIAFIDALVPGWQNSICLVTVSITRVNANPTSAASVDFTVTFNESVTDVDMLGPAFDDFALTISPGISGASVTDVSGSGATYTVTVNTGAGNGTIRLDIPDTAAIYDLTGKPLGGLPFTDGEIYTIYEPQYLTFTSTGARDGWVLESTETSGQGDSMNATATTLRLGDDAAKKQYRSILSFATGSGLPDDAVITGVTLKVRKQGITGGGNPVTAFQGFMVDIKKGYYGTSALQTADFQTAASKTYGPFKPALSSNWYGIDLTGGKSFINKLSTGAGLTQIRLRFKLDDNNNTTANYLKLYSGNVSTASRPQLIIEYYDP